MWIPCLLFLTVFQIYLFTYCASFNINDSGETIVSCACLAIGHSPGYPLHMLWGKVCVFLFPFGQPMLSVTMASLLTASLSVVVFHQILKRLWMEVLLPASPWAAEVPALLGAILFAFSRQHWFQAGGAKGGIYSLNTLLFMSLVGCLLQTNQRRKEARLLLLAAFLLGLGAANHWPSLLVMTPFFLAFYLARQTRWLSENLRRFAWEGSTLVLFFGVFLLVLLLVLGRDVSGDTPGSPAFRYVFASGEALLAALASVAGMFLWRNFGAPMVAGILTVAFLGVTPYLAMVIRASQKPVLNWWDPSNLIRLTETVSRKGYTLQGEAHSAATFFRNLTRFVSVERIQFGPILSYGVLALALWGVVWVGRRRPIWAILFAMLGGSVLVAVLFFNNPSSGFEWTLDNFFTPVHAVIVLFASAGAAGLWEVMRSFRFKTLLAGVLALLLGLGVLALNGKASDQSRYVASYDYGLNLLLGVNRTGVVLCNGDIDLLPLSYLCFVEGKRPETAFFAVNGMATDWYREQVFKNYPFLRTEGAEGTPAQTLVQDVLNRHAPERSFYYTNVSMPEWMRQQNRALVDGQLWRILSSKDLGFGFTTERVNLLASKSRARGLDAGGRGYWDEYSETLKDTWGTGWDFMGYDCYYNGFPLQARWCFKKALLFRETKRQGRLHFMISRADLVLKDLPDALAEARTTLSMDGGSPYAWMALGQVQAAMGQDEDARLSLSAALRLSPDLEEARQSLERLGKKAAK